MKIVEWLFGKTSQQKQEAQPSTTHPDAGDYCARCFVKNYTEQDDARSWNKSGGTNRNKWEQIGTNRGTHY